MCVSWNCSSSVIEYAEKLAEETSQKLLVIQWYGSREFSILLPRRIETMNIKRIFDKNQCDGCREKMPIEKGKSSGVDIHYYKKSGLPYMVCQKYRYEEVLQ